MEISENEYHPELVMTETHPVEFTGSAREWFGIWIVNLLLTILTLGIYSAWAKVRRKKYFARNTHIAGRSFDYHATGKQILIGRIIVVVVLIVYNVLVTMMPPAGIILPILFLLAYPVLMVRAIRFNAAMTSWANVRFGFDGRLGGAAKVYILYPVLAALTLYSTLPFLSRAIRRFSIGNHRLGTARFEFATPIGPFYRAFLLAILWFVVMASVAVGILAPLSGMEEQDPGVFSIIPVLVLVLAILPATSIYHAFLRNAVFAATGIEGGHRLRSEISAPRYIWIVLSNAAVTILTLGMMLPWAQIRMARYLAAHTFVLAAGSLDEFVGAEQARVAAVGDAFSDIEGWDVGLPL